MKKALNIFLISVLLVLSTQQVKANDDTKRIIGGLAAGLVGMAINEMAQDDDAQASENIQWSDNQQKRSPAATEETKTLQRDLKELGYYHGAVDGISGSGTQKAILKWEDDNCEKNDSYCRNGKLDHVDVDIINDLAENERNNRKIAEENAQRTKDRAEENRNLAATKEDVSDWLNNLSNTVNKDASFPKCKSKEALSNLQDTAENSAYSNIVKIQIFDLIDARELPNNIDTLLYEYVVDEKLKTAPSFKDKRRLCVANAVTNSGNVPIRYSFHAVEAGISDSQQYYVEYEEIEAATYNLLNSQKFYHKLYTNDSSNK